MTKKKSNFKFNFGDAVRPVGERFIRWTIIGRTEFIDGTTAYYASGYEPAKNAIGRHYVAAYEIELIPEEIAP